MEQVESLLEHGELPQEEAEPEAEAVASPEPEAEGVELQPSPGVVPERPLPEIS